MDALGRLVNIRHIADGGWVRLDTAQHVLFSCYLAGAVGDTYTLQEATTAAGAGAQNLARIVRFFTATGDGTDGWTLRTQTAAATMVTAAAATQNAAALEVDANQLSAGFKYVRLTSTGAGAVVAIQTDLNDQRTPPNLPALTV